MPDGALPTPTSDAPVALTSEQSALLTDVQQRLLTAMQPYIGESLNANTSAQMQAEVADRLRNQLLADVTADAQRDADADFITAVERIVASQPRCNICGETSCRHLTGEVRLRTERIDDLLEEDFHTNHSNVVYPAIDRLAGSSTLRTRGGVTVEATVHIYYHNYEQLQSHLNLRDDGSLHRGMVWYQGEYWVVNSITTATAFNNREYEVTLELTRATTQEIPQLRLVEEPNGQTAWVLNEPLPANVVSLDFTINGDGTVLVNPAASARVDVEEDSSEPSTVLKKPKCLVCQKRGCVSSHHIPTAEELEQSLSSTADMLNASTLNEDQSAAVRTAFETAINQIDLSQQLNAVARAVDVQSTFIPLRVPEPSILGTVVEQRGDTSYIRLGDNTTLAHDLRINGAAVTPGTNVTWDTEGRLRAISPAPTPNQ